MWLLKAIAIGALSLKCLAAEAKDPFTRFHDRAVASSPLMLDNNGHAKVIPAQRDYSVAVLMTALEPRFGCAMCRELEPEWELLAKSWAKGDKAGKSRMLFATLDFANGQEVFQRMSLQTAPILFLYLPTTGPHAKGNGEPLRYDAGNSPANAETLHGWISRHLPTGPHPPIIRPFNYLKAVFVTTAGLGLITFARIMYPVILPLIQNRNIWAAISLIAILLFTSGHMFNHIRKVPYVAGNGHGGISYFAGGFSNQFGLETQIVAGIYAVLSFATIFLALKVPRITNARQQQVAVWLWAAILMGTYSFLMSVFRIKNGGYPFWLPPFGR